MFRIELFCEDKDLPTILHSLAGRRVEFKVWPVAGSNPELMPANGSGRSSIRTSVRAPQLKRADIVAAGGAPQMFIKIMREHKLTTITAAKVKEICKQMGLSPKSYSHLLRSAEKLGFIKRGGKDPDNANGFLWKLTDKAGDR